MTFVFRCRLCIAEGKAHDHNSRTGAHIYKKRAYCTEHYRQLAERALTKTEYADYGQGDLFDQVLTAPAPPGEDEDYTEADIACEEGVSRAHVQVIRDTIPNMLQALKACSFEESPDRWLRIMADARDAIEDRYMWAGDVPALTLEAMIEEAAN